MPASCTPWDPVIRVLHWSLVMLVVSAFWFGHFGPVIKSWHFWMGYGVGVWLVMRLVWGLVGPAPARLGALVHRPGAMLAYLSGLPARHPSRWSGHNPLGGLSVAAMLLLLAAQVLTGLFADDEVFSAGPLAPMVGEGTRLSATSWHALGGWLLLGLIALHLAAILFYALWKRENLVRPMIFGSGNWGEFR